MLQYLYKFNYVIEYILISFIEEQYQLKLCSWVD